LTLSSCPLDESLSSNTTFEKRVEEKEELSSRLMRLFSKELDVVFSSKSIADDWVGVSFSEYPRRRTRSIE